MDSGEGRQGRISSRGSAQTDLSADTGRSSLTDSDSGAGIFRRISRASSTAGIFDLDDEDEQQHDNELGPSASPAATVALALEGGTTNQRQLFDVVEEDVSTPKAVTPSEKAPGRVGEYHVFSHFQLSRASP